MFHIRICHYPSEAAIHMAYIKQLLDKWHYGEVLCSYRREPLGSVLFLDPRPHLHFPIPLDPRLNAQTAPN